jgi:hypothetical protein
MQSDGRQPGRKVYSDLLLTGNKIDITVMLPRGFGLKPSTTRPVSWQRAWALAAAWREQLGEGDAGAGRGGRGRVGRVGGEGGAWARVVTAY